MSATSTRVLKMKKKTSMLNPRCASTPVAGQSRDLLPPTPPREIPQKPATPRSSLSSSLFKRKHIQSPPNNNDIDNSNGNNDDHDDDMDLLNLSTDDNQVSQRAAQITPDSSFDEMRKAHESLTLQHEELQNRYKALEDEQQAMKTSLEELENRVNKKKKKKIIPRKEIRSFVRMSYQENKDEWSLNKSDSLFNGVNRSISAKIREDVKGLDTSATDEEINSAMSTYFQSLRSYKLKIEKNPNAVNNAAKYQRKQHKLRRRLTALEAKTSILEHKKEKIRKLLVIDLQSSEDEDDEQGRFIVRPLAWRSRKMNNLIDALDQKTESLQSKTARCQTLKRVLGENSDRKCPEKLRQDPEFEWAITIHEE